MLPEIPLAAPLKEEDKPAATTVLKDECLVLALAVERDSVQVLIQEHRPESADGQQRLAHPTMIADPSMFRRVNSSDWTAVTGRTHPQLPIAAVEHARIWLDLRGWPDS